jgi:hypothetical protein
MELEALGKKTQNCQKARKEVNYEEKNNRYRSLSL